MRLNSGQGNILPNAPLQPDFIGKLPAINLSATRNPSALGPNDDPLALDDASLTLSDAPLRDDAGFVLSFQSPAFTGPVLVLATRPLSAGVTQPSLKDFRQIALFPSFTASLYNLSGPYASQFPDPAVGMKIAIQFVPVTPTGFRGNPFTRIVTVTL